MAECLESVLAQTMTDFEVIAVNDGSEDSTGAILGSYAAGDGRVRVLDQANGGVSAARNAGLDIAKGQWVTFVDADDTLPVDAFESLASHIADDVDAVFGGYVFEKDGELEDPAAIAVRRLSNSDLALELFNPRRYMRVVWAKLYRRAILEKFKIRFDSAIRYNEDRLFALEYLRNSRGGVITTQSVYHYRLHGTSAMSGIEGPGFVRFETDLDAFVKMHALAGSFRSPRLQKAIVDGAKTSYNVNRRLNRQYGSDDATTNRRLKAKLSGLLSPKMRLKFLLRKLYVPVIQYFTQK